MVGTATAYTNLECQAMKYIQKITGVNDAF